MKIFKKFISLFLIFTICFMNVGNTFAEAKQSAAIKDIAKAATKQLTPEEFRQIADTIPQEIIEEFPELQNMIDKTYQLFEENNEPITEKLLMQTPEFEKLSKVIDKIGEKSEQIDKKKELEELQRIEKILKTTESNDFKEFEKNINSLAQEYYEYYQIHGEYPTEENGEQSNISIRSLSTADAVPVFEEMGYYISEGALATELATLGALAGLEAALPVIILVALVAGVIYAGYTLSSTSDLELIYEERYSIANEIEDTFDSDAYSHAIEAATMTYTLVEARTSRYPEYFEAFRNNGPGGGILIGAPLSYDEALARVRGDDIYAILGSSFAQTVADDASIGSSAVHDKAHNTTQQPANLPHWHPTMFGVRYGGHSFYY